MITLYMKIKSSHGPVSRKSRQLFRQGKLLCLLCLHTRSKFQQDAIGAYTWASLYHAYVRIFCQAGVSAAMLLIAEGWLKWVKKKTWSHWIVDVASVNWLTV